DDLIIVTSRIRHSQKASMLDAALARVNRESRSTKRMTCVTEGHNLHALLGCDLCVP
ncbi:unnamed protein product, partial [Mycena citricolor]